MENFGLITSCRNSIGVVVSGRLPLTATHVTKTIDFGIYTKLGKVAFSSILHWITFNFILIAHVRSTKQWKYVISVCAVSVKE